MPVSDPAPSLLPVNFVTGISDGLLLPLAACIVAFPFVTATPYLCALAGICLALPGACVFGLARFLGEQEEIHHHHPGLAATEAITESRRMEAIGIDRELTAEMQARMHAERMQWLREMQEHGMGWDKPDKARAGRAALHTAAGFMAGGVLVSLPFFYIQPSLRSVPAVLLAALALCSASGWCKGLVTGRKPYAVALLQLAWGLVIALCALGAGWFMQPGGYAWTGY